MFSHRSLLDDIRGCGTDHFSLVLIGFGLFLLIPLVQFVLISNQVGSVELIGLCWIWGRSEINHKATGLSKSHFWVIYVKAVHINHKFSFVFDLA